MARAASKNANVKLLACLIDEDDENDSDYRFLVDGQNVKYVTTAPGTFRGFEDDCTFEPVLLSRLLPQFPLGDWNSGHVARGSNLDEATFLKTETTSYAGVQNVWHPVRLSEVDFTERDRLRQRVRIATHPGVNNGLPVIMKLAVWPWEMPDIERETSTYQRLREQRVGPRFLGHLREGKDGRVVGIIAEWVPGARAAGPGDLSDCARALGRLHELGIKLGDVNKHNFLVREGHEVVLIDFERARFDCSASELDEEMISLKDSLEDTSYLGGVRPVSE